MKNKIEKNQASKKQTTKKQTDKNRINAKNIRNHVSGQNPQASVVDVPVDWFYMSDQEMTAAALKEALADTAYKVEYWEEAQVLEIALGEGGCLDVEVMDPCLEEEAADAFLKEHRVKFLCYITFQPEDYEAARSVMEHICYRIGGFFCGDTEDFTPVIRAQE